MPLTSNVTVRRLVSGDESIACAVAATFKNVTIGPGLAEAFLANRVNYLLVAELSGNVAGFLLAYRLDRLDRPASQLFVYEVAVAQQSQRHGVGRALMEAARTIVAAEGWMEAFVFTSRTNGPAMGLYAATGGQVEDGDAVCIVYPGAAPDGP